MTEPLPDVEPVDPSWWRTTPALLIALGVTLAVVITVVVVLGKSSIGNDEDAVDAASPAVESALIEVARAEAVAFFSLDHRTVEADVEKVLALATGEFKEQYAANKAQVVAQVKEKKLISVATIPEEGVAVEFISGDQAQILVVVDVARRIGSKADQLRNRARILATLVDGRWLVSGVNQVG